MKTSAGILLLYLGITLLLGLSSVSLAHEGHHDEEHERPKVTHVVEFDISDGHGINGTVRLGLFGDIVPKTVRNFFILSKRPKGKGYIGSKFHRVIDNFMIQGGDFTRGDGRGGQSIFKDGKSFKDENFVLKHVGAGDLSMANAGPDTNGSQFFITLIQTDWLDGRHVVFGRVIQGLRLIKRIGRVAVVEGSKPVHDVVIVGVRAQKL